MPTCELCRKHFKNYATIDGKKKNLSNRKYCLECSPWGKHNTRRLLSTDDSRCECTSCGREYEYDPKNRNGFTRSKCNSCLVNDRRFNLKLKAINLKGGGCVKCGYKANASALTFHHIDPSQKEFNIGGMHCRKWSSIEEELAKCILLCHNCHAEIHNEKMSLKEEEDGELVFV